MERRSRRNRQNLSLEKYRKYHQNDFASLTRFENSPICVTFRSRASPRIYWARTEQTDRQEGRFIEEELGGKD